MEITGIMSVPKFFFGLIKRECIRRKVYVTCDGRRADIFNDIEMFYNSVRRHGYNDGLSPTEFEVNYFEKQLSL